MEIYQLRTLLAVARLGHLTRASEQLHMTQPAVSKQIRALEEQLGVTLFERTPVGMTPTKACQTLIPHAEQTLEQATILINVAREMGGEMAGVLRLGTIIDPDSLRLGDTLWRVLQNYPLIDIKLQHGISGWVMQRVLSGELDAGFYLGPVTDPRLDYIALKQVNYRIIAPLAWANQLHSADWPALAAMPWVGTPPHSSQQRIVKEMFAEHSLVPNYTVEADQEASMLSLVRSGAALCIMREELSLQAEERGELHVLPGHVRPCMLSFVFDRIRQTDTPIAVVAKVINEVWAL